MKIALITDTHWGARNDSLIFYDYMMKFYDNIFFKELESRNIKTIIHLGDVVDRRKFINFNILHNFKNNFLKRLMDMKIDTHIIIGNHDTYFKNSNKVNAMESLIDVDNPLSPKIYSSIDTVNFGGLDICLCPWINTDNYDESISHLNDTTSKLVFGHLEISGFLMNSGVRCFDGIKKSIVSRFERVYSGHFHHKSIEDNITYLGNPYELTWSDYKDDRGFHIFDTDTLELEFIKNTYTIFEKIFYDEDIVDDFDFSYYNGKFIKIIVNKKTDIYKFDLFVDTLYKNDVIDINIIDETMIDGVGIDDNVSIDDDTMSLVSTYIDRTIVDVDKDKLKNIINDVYMDVLREI
jgi:DNA repair exonuclease SbcCD nuclease subunit